MTADLGILVLTYFFSVFYFNLLSTITLSNLLPKMVQITALFVLKRLLDVELLNTIHFVLFFQELCKVFVSSVNQRNKN